MIKKKNALMLVIFSSVICSLLTFTMTGMIYGTGISKEDQWILQETRKLMSLKQYIEDHYVEGTDNIDLMDGATKGLFAILGDPYSGYYNPEEFAALQEYVSGSFNGIGVNITENENREVVIISPIKDTPAYEVGIKSGDIVVKVDGVDVKGMTSSQVIRMIKGEKGTKVSIAVRREGTAEPISFEMKRELIHTESVIGEVVEGDIAYIKMTQFDEDTHKEFNNVVSKLNIEKCKGMILDLRQNGGGYVDQCTKVADEFLNDGLIVYTEDNNGNQVKFEAKQGAIDLPMVVLIDEGSASASEILAGALQDRQVGTLVGVKSFGKGLVQDVRALPDGSGFKLTIQKYYTPKGRNINKIGIDPDVVVEAGDETDDVQLKKATEVLKSKMN